MKLKECLYCDEAKPLSEFYKDCSRPDGHSNKCKACEQVVSRERCWRRLGLKITYAAYMQMYSDQHGACAVCLEECDQGMLAVDHNHRTKGVRGLLCARCNLTLGKVDDDSLLLRRMAEYLEEHAT